jgi:hypothetical protein
MARSGLTMTEEDALALLLLRIETHARYVDNYAYDIGEDEEPGICTPGATLRAP